MSNEIKLTCCLCGEDFEGYGNNPYPLPMKNEDDRCCDECNYDKVIPERLYQIGRAHV